MHSPMISACQSLVQFTWHLPRDFLKRYLAHDYTVEVRNRFKGLNLIDRVPEELWMGVCDTVKEAGIKTILKEKKGKKAK